MKSGIFLLLGALMCSVIVAGSTSNAYARTLTELNDGEIAHVVHTADVVNVRYAYMALALSENPETREFARTLIRDHEEVTQQRQALLQKLGIEAQDNFLSQKISTNARFILDELSVLRGAEFDKRYVENELVFHQAVNGLVADSFVPIVENDDLKELFKAGLQITKAHASHADVMVRKLNITNLM